MSFSILLDGVAHSVDIVARRPHLVLRIDGRLHTIHAQNDGRAGDGEIVIDGERVHATRGFVGETQYVRVGGRTFEARVDTFEGSGTGGGAALDAIKAPMPGAVVRIHKQAGDMVARGEAVVTIESMKLQTTLAAPRDGVIEILFCEEGGAFEKDAIVARLAPVSED